jgi:plastocyanin
MRATRRQALQAGGGILAALLLRPLPVSAAEVVEVAMQGTPDGSDVWFDPIGILVQPGQAIRWTNRDPGNSHTVTSYHPSLFDRPRRIPEGATPWDSDYLLPDESFSLTLSVPGVYDYYCVPHEHAGMVGRIIVGTPDAGAADYAKAGAGLTELPAAALAGFPDVAAIIAAGAVHRD